MIKKCTKCKQEFPVDNFCRDSQKSDGLSSHCKACRKKQRDKYYKENKEKCIQSCYNWQKNNPEKRAAIAKRHREKNKYRWYLYCLKSRLGLSEEQVQSVIDKANNSCEICGKSEEQNGKRLSIDHCHSTKEVRGLLCDNCNTGLGMFKDNITSLQNAIKYLGG